MASPRVKDTNRNIPDLPGWTAAPVAAEQIGLSRQWLADMINAGTIKTAHKLPGTGERPAVIMIRTAEVKTLAKAREEAKTCPQCRQMNDPPKVCTHRAQDTPADPEMEAALGF
jgi:hypothetical protein